MFAQPGYRRVFTARAASQTGDLSKTVALSLAVLRLAGFGIGVSGVKLTAIVSVLLFAPLTGTLADQAGVS